MNHSEFEPVTKGITKLINEWVPRLSAMAHETITGRRNSQGRTIKQITGHMIDSASNNLHRIVHLQYQDSPLIYPNYASHGNNDRWIAIQHYQEEDWDVMINLWKYANLHLVHVIEHMDVSKLDHLWHAGDQRYFSLEEMIVSYLQHLELHLGEIEELL